MFVKHQATDSFSQPQSSSFIKCLVQTASKSFRPIIYHLQLYVKWYLTFSLILWLAPTTVAQDNGEPIFNCTSIADEFTGNAQLMFNIPDWLNRGLCVRGSLDSSDFQCYSRLQLILSSNLNEIRKAEYNGAAGVLALLPTIGALLGTPTNEIWRLLTMIPFGGLLATASSFGGAMLPVRIKDYESDFMKNNITESLRNPKSASRMWRTDVDDHHGRTRVQERADILMGKVYEKLQSDSQEKVPYSYIWIGLTGMSLLLAGAQVAMTIIELGAVLPWWCVSKWWVHLWYLMGMSDQMDLQFRTIAKRKQLSSAPPLIATSSCPSINSGDYASRMFHTTWTLVEGTALLVLILKMSPQLMVSRSLSNSSDRSRQGLLTLADANSALRNLAMCCLFMFLSQVTSMTGAKRLYNLLVRLRASPSSSSVLLSLHPHSFFPLLWRPLR